MGFPGGSDGKDSSQNMEDLGSIPGLGKFPGEGKGYTLQYSGLENSMDHIVCGFYGPYSLWGCKESDVTFTLIHWFF